MTIPMRLEATTLATVDSTQSSSVPVRPISELVHGILSASRALVAVAARSLATVAEDDVTLTRTVQIGWPPRAWGWS